MFGFGSRAPAYSQKYSLACRAFFHVILGTHSRQDHSQTKNFLFARSRLTDIENRLVVAKGKAGGGGKDWEFGIVDANYYIENG